MSAKITTENKKPDSEEDENWDNWDDAEEQLEEPQDEVKKDEPKQKREAPVRKEDTKAPTKEETSNKNINATEKATETPAIASPTESLKSNTSSSWGGSMWKAFSTATESLSNITSTVSHGLNNVIGVPDPEDLARINAAAQEETRTKPPSESIENETNQKKAESPTSAGEDPTTTTAGNAAFGFSLVSGVTTLGSKVLNTGLDTLEGIGKKTMDILQENDPLLMNKRKMLGLDGEKPNLSEALQEAKREADELENSLKTMKLNKIKEDLRFELIFDHACGLVHLEALEILSKESTLRLQSLFDSVSGKALVELKETTDEVKELMELEDLEGESDGNYSAKQLNAKLLELLEDIKIEIRFDEIVDIWSTSLVWISDVAPTATEQEIHATALPAIAATCAFQINKLHKIAELLLIQEHHSTASEVDCIAQLCKEFNSHLNGMTNRFCATLTKRNTEEAKICMSNLFAEMLVAVKNINKAFNLFLPIIQIGIA